MKKRWYITAATILLFGSCGEVPNLTGEISGMDSDTILIYQSDAINSKLIGIDTVALDNGHFETNLPSSTIMNIALVAKNRYGETGQQVIEKDFMFFPEDQMSINGTLPFDVNATGTELYDQLHQDNVLTAKAEEVINVSKALDELEVIDEEKEDSLYAIYDKKYEELQHARMNFVQTYPDSRAAAYLTLYLEGETGIEAISLLSDNIRNGEMKPLLDNWAAYCKNEIEVERHRQNVQSGFNAPDFHLKDLDGNLKSLTDFKGTYTILDFWGTWCGWCLAGIPQMKEYYSKYSHQLELVSICCEDKESNWRKCVKKQEMNWIQLFCDSSDSTTVKYGINGYPTKILIDKNGKILNRFEGESQEFYDYLDELFKK